MRDKNKERQERRKSDASAWAAKEDTRFERTAVKLPDGVKFMKFPSPGVYELDVIPYVVPEGARNPNADDGFEHFEREYHVHRIPGPDGRNKLYCCAWKNFRKQCYVCQWMKEHGVTLDEKTKKDMNPQVRHLWNVIDLADKDKKIQVLDTNHYNRGFGFGEMVKDAIANNPKYARFANLQGGYTWRLTVKEQSMPGAKFNGVVRIDFDRREHAYDENMLEKAVVLDKCLLEPNEDELNEILNQGGGKADAPADDDRPARRRDDDDDAPAPKAKTSRKSRDDDDDEPAAKESPKAATKDAPKTAGEKTAEQLGYKVGDLVMHKGIEYKIIRVSEDGTKLKLEDEDNERVSGVSPADVKPVKTADAPKAKAKAAEPDDDDDDDSELEPPPKAQSKSAGKAAAADADDDDPDDSDLDDDDSDVDDDDDDD